MSEIIVDVGNYLSLGVIALFSTMFVAILFFAILKIRNCLDRYRLKYGFNFELEGKEWGNDPDKLEQRKKLFEKRTFTD